MKRMTLKTRLVLLHTAMMTVVVCGVLAVLFSAGFREILTNVRGTLETRVSRSIEDVEYNNGRLEFDSELLALDNGVYLSVYEPDSPEMLYGRLPYGFTYDLPFSDGALRTVTAGNTEYCVLDIEFPVEGYHDLVLRGIISVSADSFPGARSPDGGVRLPAEPPGAATRRADHEHGAEHPEGKGPFKARAARRGQR